MSFKKTTLNTVVAPSETTTAMLKFELSKRDNHTLISFVSQDNVSGFLYGRRADDRWPKKICIVDDAIRETVQPGFLYMCTLTPMKLKDGYIVIEAKPHRFPAVVSMTCIPHHVYQVQVKFGQKLVWFDPKDGRKDSTRTIEGVVELLRSRIDIENQDKVIKNFRKHAELLVENFIKDGFIYKPHSEVS